MSVKIYPLGPAPATELEPLLDHLLHGAKLMPNMNPVSARAQQSEEEETVHVQPKFGR